MLTTTRPDLTARSLFNALLTDALRRAHTAADAVEMTTPGVEVRLWATPGDVMEAADPSDIPPISAAVVAEGGGYCDAELFWTMTATTMRRRLCSAASAALAAAPPPPAEGPRRPLDAEPQLTRTQHRPEPRHAGEDLRVTIATFNGFDFTSLRVWAKAPDGRPLPVKGKGLSLKVHELCEVAEALLRAADELEDNGPQQQPPRRGPRRPTQEVGPSTPDPNASRGGFDESSA